MSKRRVSEIICSSKVNFLGGNKINFLGVGQSNVFKYCTNAYVA